MHRRILRPLSVVNRQLHTQTPFHTHQSLRRSWNPKTEDMLTVHHLNDSRSQRILWLLEELEVPYELKKYQRNADGSAPPELVALSPLGKSPLITDGDVTLGESGAIVDYIITTHGNGKAIAKQTGYVDNLYYSHYAEGSLMPVLVLKFIFTIVPKRSPFFIRPFLGFVFSQLDKKIVEPQIAKHLAMIESHLGKSKSIWFAGGDEPTAADYQMTFALEAVASEIPDFVASSPNIKKYVETVHSRPAYKKALEKGGEYAYAKL